MSVSVSVIVVGAGGSEIHTQSCDFILFVWIRKRDNLALSRPIGLPYAASTRPGTKCSLPARAVPIIFPMPCEPRLRRPNRCEHRKGWATHVRLADLRRGISAHCARCWAQINSFDARRKHFTRSLQRRRLLLICCQQLGIRCGAAPSAYRRQWYGQYSAYRLVVYYVVRCLRSSCVDVCGSQPKAKLQVYI